MVGSVDANNKELQFCWGKKGGYGGSMKEHQFYKSFTMDYVTYSLYDCVYLYKAGNPEPYIGKIIKMVDWYNPKSKKKERKGKILWFFRPSEIMNYLGDYELSEKEIFLASGEGRGLFNLNPLEAIAGKCSVICTAKDERNPQPSKEDLEMADYIFSCTFRVDSRTISQKIDDQIAGIEVKFLFNRIEDLESRPASNLEDSLILANVEAGQIKDKRLVASTSPDQVENSLKPSKMEANHEADKERPMSKLEDCGILENVEAGQIKDKRLVILTSSVQVENSLKPYKMEANHDADQERPSKKVKFSEDTQNDTAGKKIASEKDEKPGLKMIKVTKKPEPGPPGGRCVSGVADSNVLPIPRDKSKWFKAFPWIARLRKADDLGKLVLVENLDPSYTSSEIEGIFNDTFNQNCTVKVIPQGSFQNPNYGQAYAIFETRDAADMVVSRINQGCLLQPNGSPLICSKGQLKVPEQDLRGHLSIDNKVKWQREEMRSAVSTSHCSQPNTIEYEMAAEWLVLQEKFRRHANFLFKEQVKEQNAVKKKLKMN